ncbi:hypothetical protein V8G57_02110 [Collimonas sp. H4R21]|uniref:N-acetylmuramoyl-L-alanine amidase n=1 Tax=Collimonas rhizosphaerae TaxID=3126357 RepID=A0ABU9PQA8_9BURK
MTAMKKDDPTGLRGVICHHLTNGDNHWPWSIGNELQTIEKSAADGGTSLVLPDGAL